MSQVKNLRAMFENKADTSPPDRGRSPAAGVSTSTANPAGPNGTGSPRPLSKVRTSFVAIEKDGRMGLRRDHSGESSLSRRRMSTETDAESISTFPDKPAVASDDATKPTRRPLVGEPIPESPRQPLDAVPPSHNAAGVVSDKPVTSPVKQPGDDHSSSAPGPAAPEYTKAKEPTSASSPRGSLADKSTAPSGASAPAQSKDPPPSAVSAKPATTRMAATAPLATKASTGAPTRAHGKSAVKPSEKPGAKRAAAGEARTATTASRPRPMSSTTANRPQPSRAAGHCDSGFVKPKPKSPTKPVSLPSSLTAPTASSVSKGSASRQSLYRQSGGLQNPDASSHPSTRESRRQRPAPSRPGRPRLSVGPPPGRPSQSDTGMAAKRQSHVDEGFLARMMRPTQASSSKTSDKAPPTTPPKRIAAQPSAAATDRSLRQEANARKPALATNATARRPGRSRSQEPDARRPPDPVAHEQARTETTETVASFALDATDNRTPVVSGDQAAAPEPNPGNAVVVETAQVEEAAELAQGADPVETPVEPRDTASAPGPATAHDLASETAHIETVGTAIGLVRPESPEPLELAPSGGPAPQKAHSEATEGGEGPPHEVAGQGVGPSERPTVPLGAAGLPENTGGDAGAAECRAEEPSSNPAAAASGGGPTAAAEAQKGQPVSLHGATQGTEDHQHEAEGSHHNPQGVPVAEQETTPIEVKQPL